MSRQTTRTFTFKIEVQIPSTCPSTATYAPILRAANVLGVYHTNRDLRFVSKFWDELFSLLGMDLRFSTAFHPQTDVQSEVTIRVLENFLQPYIEHRPSTWVSQLPLVEFAANNAVNVSTGYSPFYLNQGSHPIVPNTLLAKGEPEVSNVVVKEALERMKTALVDAKSNLTTAQQCMKRVVDKKRRTEEYKIDDEVVLSTTNL